MGEYRVTIDQAQPELHEASVEALGAAAEMGELRRLLGRATGALTAGLGVAGVIFPTHAANAAEVPRPHLAPPAPAHSEPAYDNTSFDIATAQPMSPAPTDQAPAYPSGDANQGFTSHTIQPGDTFWELNEQDGLPQGTLEIANPGLVATDLPVDGHMEVPVVSSNESWADVAMQAFTHRVTELGGGDVRLAGPNQLPESGEFVLVNGPDGEWEVGTFSHMVQGSDGTQMVTSAGTFAADSIVGFAKPQDMLTATPQPHQHPQPPAAVHHAPASPLPPVIFHHPGPPLHAIQPQPSQSPHTTKPSPTPSPSAPTGNTGHEQNPSNPEASSGLNVSAVPSAYVPWILKAAKTYNLNPALLAAQLYQESDIGQSTLPGVHSGTNYAGAMGPAQFLKSTWAEWGIDADHDGTANPYSPADAVMSEARFLRYLIDEVQKQNIPGDPVANGLAAYNAGLGNVEHFNGVPPESFAGGQAYNYVRDIMGPLMKKFEAHAKAVVQRHAAHITPHELDPRQEIQQLKQHLQTPAPSESQASSDQAPPAPDFVDLSGYGAHMVHWPEHGLNALIIHYTESDLAGADLGHYFDSGELGIQFDIDQNGNVYRFFDLNNMQAVNQIGDMNPHSIGIEVAGSDGSSLIHNQKQFNSVVKTVKYLCYFYKIPCGDPKGTIDGYYGLHDGSTSGQNAANLAQGLLGHDEAPNYGNPVADHADPDANVSNGQLFNPITGQPWAQADRCKSDEHPYMEKLRRALGLLATPGLGDGQLAGCVQYFNQGGA